jgi:putative membrane protein
MLWVKAFHIVAVIAWMAGLLYLPRLFVYHCDAETGSTQSETFKTMERRLYRAIMGPAMMTAWVLGLVLVYQGSYWGETWMIAKFSLVASLTALHVVLGWHRAAFERDENRHSARYFRILNEVPTLLMIAIVILAVIKPF